MLEGERSAQDVLSRSLRLTLGGTEHVLQVLFIAGNERWREFERKTTSEFVTALEISGETTRGIIDAWNTQTDLQLDLLYAYDTDCGLREGTLPPREVLKEQLYEDELEAALREVVRAANPKAYSAVGAVRQAVEAIRSMEPSSGQPPSTDGPQKKSGTPSPMSN